MKIILTGVEVLSLAVFLSVYEIIQLAGVTVREKSAVRRHRAPQSADSDDSNGRVAASIPWPSSKSQITQTDERCRWKRALGNWCALNAVVTPSPAMRIDGEENGHRKPIMLVLHNDTCHYHMYKGLKCKKSSKILKSLQNIRYRNFFRWRGEVFFIMRCFVNKPDVD